MGARAGELVGLSVDKQDLILSCKVHLGLDFLCPLKQLNTYTLFPFVPLCVCVLFVFLSQPDIYGISKRVGVSIYSVFVVNEADRELQ